MRGTFLIGRDAACDLRPKSSQVSDRHCAIISNDATVIVKDLNSRAGTYVNESRVHGARRLAAGDRVRVGPLTLAVQMVPDTDTEVDGYVIPDRNMNIRDGALRPTTELIAPDDADVLLADLPVCDVTAIAHEPLDTPPEDSSAGNAESNPDVLLAPLVAYVAADCTESEQQSPE
jgi:pSer/pThr/pTyr-binding forkhead associated (FHA) protein